MRRSKLAFRQFWTTSARSSRGPASRMTTERPAAASWLATNAPTTPEPTTITGRVGRHLRDVGRHSCPPERAEIAVGGHGQAVAHRLVHQGFFVSDHHGTRAKAYRARIPGGNDAEREVFQTDLRGGFQQRFGRGVLVGERNQLVDLRGLLHACRYQGIANALGGDGADIGVVGEALRQQQETGVCHGRNGGRCTGANTGRLRREQIRVSR
jgi:hypothetical protein